MPQTALRCRCVAVVAVATLALAVVAHRLSVGVTTEAADPATAATRICTVVLLLALGWAWLTVVAGAVDAWRRVGGYRGVPAARVGGSRRVVLALCGVACTGAVLTPVAQASTSPTAVTTPTSTASPSAHHDAHRPHLAVAEADVVVRPGDCLWSIAASQVQPGAGPMTVTARWHALYAANHGVIGDDPDLIRPGQRLRMPH